MKTLQVTDLTIETKTCLVEICSDFYTKLHILKLLLVWLHRWGMLDMRFFFIGQLLQMKWCDWRPDSNRIKRKAGEQKKEHFIITDSCNSNKMNLFKYNNLKSDHNQTNEKKIRHSLIYTNGLLHMTLSKELLCRRFLLTPVRKKKKKSINKSSRRNCGSRRQRDATPYLYMM